MAKGKNEDIEILNINVDGAVKSVNDLKNNIKLLKEQLMSYTDVTQDNEEEWKKYQQTLKDLRTNQEALKDAMYNTTGTFEDVLNTARGANRAYDEQIKQVDLTKESYNSLVHMMARLKEEWRSTTDETRRGELGEEIDRINTRLKGLDSTIGNFQRNVGNYEGALKNFHAVVKDMPSAFGGLKGALDGVDKSMGVMSVNPMMGFIFLITPVIQSIVSALKDTENGTESINKALEALKPIADIFKKALETLASLMGTLVDKFVEFGGEGGETFKKIIAGAVGVGNSLLQFLLTPIRTIIDAVKGLGDIFKDVFTGNFSAIKDHAKTAIDGIGDAFKKGFSFKDNFELGKKVGEEFIAGLGSDKPKAEEEGKEIGKAIAKGVEEGLDELSLDNILKNLEKAQRAIEAEIDQRLKEQKEANDMMEQLIAESNAEIDAWFEEEYQKNLERLEEEKRVAEQMVEARKTLMKTAVGTTISLLNSLASFYESDNKNSAKNANKIKALRIASSTIDTLNGAIGAFTQASETIPPPYGQAVGVANASAVMAMGMANIAKIKSVNVNGGGSAPSVGASVSAPSTPTAFNNVRNVTSASEEDRLNRMADDQRVVLVMSDLEVKQGQVMVQTQESTF